MIRLFSYSLSVRLVVIFIGLAALFATGAVLAVRWIYATDDLRELISGHLTLHVDYVRRDIGDPPRLDRARAIAAQVPVDIRIDGPDLHWATDPAFPEPAELDFGPSRFFSDAPDGWLRELPGVDYALKDGHRFLRFAEGAHQVIVVTPKIGQRPARPALLPIIIGFGLGLLLLAYFAVRALFRPIAAIREGAARYGQGRFDVPIPATRGDELGALAADVNRMAAELRGMLEAKRQLMLGISHELRSPLSRVRLALEFVDDLRVREPIREDVVEMERIIETLLEAERLNGLHASLRLTHDSLREIVLRVVETYFERSRDRLVLELAELPAFRADEARLTLLIKNLVSNALRHSRPEDGPVRITTRRGPPGWVELAVCDAGPGLDPAIAERLGEPFARGDRSRTRETGGTGLGLYLALQVARAHGGDLVSRPPPGRGACLVVVLPEEGAPGPERTH